MNDRFARGECEMTGLGLPRAEAPEQVGLSSVRLRRLADIVRGDVERGLIPGAVVLIARGGRVGYAVAFGYSDREADQQKTQDSTFTLASLYTPITPVRALISS